MGSVMKLEDIEEGWNLCMSEDNNSTWAFIYADALLAIAKAVKKRRYIPRYEELERLKAEQEIYDALDSLEKDDEA